LIPADFIVLGVGLAVAGLGLGARNRRAALTLSVLVIVFVVGAIALAGVAQFLVKSAVIGAYAVIVMFLPRALGLPSARDRTMDSKLRSIMEPVQSGISVWERDPSEEAMLATADACDIALERLESLEHPPRQWQTAVGMARRYVSAVRDVARSNDPSTPTALPPSTARPALKSLAREVDDAWRKAALL